MARPLRIEFPNAFYHVTSRGDGREAIYLQPDDFLDFLKLFNEVSQRFLWRCHAYCLMTNHYHLLLQTQEGNLSWGMRHLNGVYTQRFNRRHRRVGHVLQGRYKAILVDADGYLLEQARYMVLNPVRANMLKAAGQWPWSSYRAMIGKTLCPPWLETDQVLGHFAEDRREAQRRFIQFVTAAKQHADIWKHLNQQIYLGDSQFVARM